MKAPHALLSSSSMCPLAKIDSYCQGLGKQILAKPKPEGLDGVHRESVKVCGRCTDAWTLLLDHLSDPTLKPKTGSYSTFSTKHHDNAAELKISAQSCALCQLFFVHGESHQSGRDALHPSVWSNLWTRPKNFLIEFWILHTGFEPPQVSDICYKFDDRILSRGVWFDFAQAETHTSSVFHDRDIAQYPPFDLARRWVAECTSCHTSLCGTPRCDGLPTRLIDVGDNVTDPKLVITAETDCIRSPGDQVLYVALSHCWGQQVSASRTTVLTIGEHTQRMRLSTLEPNFQDAIIATRSLGYRYLWIDTFCIVQDSDKDWQLECSRMAMVYAGAQVTLAAAASPDMTFGFLKERPRPSGLECIMTIDAIQRFCVRRATNSDKGGLSNRGLDSILNDRAWALQERLLSMRVLHFGLERMAFECRKGVKYEFERPFDGSFVSHRITGSKLPWLTRDPDAARFRTGKLDAFSPFYDVVVEFSACKLTKKDDMLPALSGIAREYSRWNRDEYLAGLWRSSLLQGLCWERARQEYFMGMTMGYPINSAMSTQKEPVTYRTPSWSWASLNREIRVRSGSQSDENIVSSAEVIDAKVCLVGHDPFGQVDGGEIILRGWARNYRFGIITSIPGRLSSLVPSSRSWFFPWLEFIPDDPSGPAYLQDVTFFMLFDTMHRVNDKVWQHWYAIALEPVKRGPEGTFRRIGHAIGLGKSTWIKGGAIRTVRIV